MIILTDSREQSPLDFSSYNIVTDVITTNLKEGDYMCEFTNGYRPPVVFERKSVGDLFGTMGKGYPRFKREMERAKRKDVKLILIIEGSLSRVLRGHKHSRRLKGPSVVMKLFTLRIRYGLETVFCKDRAEMVEYLVQTFSALGREELRKV